MTQDLNAIQSKLDPYQPLFEKYGQQYGVDPVLLRSIAGAESAGKPNAVSSKGAKGLMQHTAEFSKQWGDDGTPEGQIASTAKFLQATTLRMAEILIMLSGSIKASMTKVIGDRRMLLMLTR